LGEIFEQHLLVYLIMLGHRHKECSELTGWSQVEMTNSSLATVC